MRTIMVMNAKGGCGKSTLATSLASYYASEEGGHVALADFDPQGSSIDWLATRPAERPGIEGIAGWEQGLKGIGRGYDYVIIDAPARSHGAELTDLVRRAETIIVPVLPSPIDMKAATRFIEELRHVGKVERKQVKIGLVANRVREQTLISHELREFLDKQRIPFLASLRDAQNYVRAFSRGLGIWELPPYLAWPDWDQWEPMMQWLDSRRSRA